MEDIFAVDSSHPVLKLLRMAISTGKDIVGIRFSSLKQRGLWILWGIMSYFSKNLV